MESFSWSDSLRALAAPCLSCLRTPKSERSDLEDLLVDSSSTTDAETLSLHSNPGSPRRKRTRFTRSIRLFGWNLFGRPPIHLPDDDDDEDDDNEAGTSRRPRRRPPPAAISTTTLDSDAAPLDTAAIESHATKRAEEEAARAERRARRRERKERKRAAEIARALEHAAVLDGDAEFEGFPGSGGRRPAPASQGSSEYRDDDDEDDEEEGDFGAGVYARRSRGGSDSGRGSDSRSRTSTSLSSGPKLQQQQAQPYNHHYISQQPSASPALPPAQRSKKGKSSRSSASKTSSSSRRSHSRSSPSASQSPSLASPVATQFLDPVPAPPRSTTQQQFEGFPNDLGLHTVGIERLSSGFPSPGFGGPRNGKRDMGAFLANRGDA
jgi:hypothetical protein